MAYVRNDVQTLLDQLKAMGGLPMNEMPAAEGRALYRTMAAMVDPPRGDLAEVRALSIPGPAGPIAARLYRAAAAADGALLVYYHGGGWVIGDLDSHDSLCAEIARQLALTVVAIDYRLAPEHPFPAAADDCLAATRWLAGSPAELGQAVTALVVAGDSAGGNLAAVVAQALHGQLPVEIAAQWLIYPGVDMVGDYVSLADFGEGFVLTRPVMDWFQASYVPDAADYRDPRASPLLSESLAGQPPAMVLVCGLDPLRDQGRAYAARLVEAGVDVRFREAAGQVHGCMTMRAAIPSAQADLDACLADLKAMLA